MASDATDEGFEPVDRFDVPVYVDWIAGALLVLAGLAAMLGGTALALLVDRQAIETGIEEGTIEVSGLSQPDAVEVLFAVSTWSGLGLLAAGILLVVAGVVFVVARRRVRRRGALDAATRGNFLANAVYGALVSALTGFIPFSPVLGGAVAGYLERGESRRTVAVGAVSGLLLSVPVVVFLAFLFVGLALASVSVGAGGFAAVLAILMVIGLGITALFGAGLGGLGGLVGGKLAED